VLADRHVKARTFIFAGEDAADLKYKTHDFTDGYKVIPFGVMVYDLAADIKFYQDRHEKKRILLPNSHRLFVTNRFNQFGEEEVPATCLQHKIGVKAALHACFPGEVPAVVPSFKRDWRSEIRERELHANHIIFGGERPLIFHN